MGGCHGLDRQAKNKQGQTALDLAQKFINMKNAPRYASWTIFAGHPITLDTLGDFVRIMRAEATPPSTPARVQAPIASPLEERDQTIEALEREIERLKKLKISPEPAAPTPAAAAGGRAKEGECERKE